MSLLLSLPLIALGCCFMWPVVARLLRSAEHTADSSPSTSLQTAITSVAFSLGTFSLALMWIGLLPRPYVTGITALLVLGIGLGAGLLVNRSWFSLSRWRLAWSNIWRRLVKLDFEALILWIVILAIWIMLINALYYPFSGDDTLSRYGLQAKQIYLAHRIPPGVWGYPPAMPLTWAGIWFAAGGFDEHLARLYSVVTASGAIAATYLLGREAGGRRVGLLASLLLILTPLFFRNSTVDYTDVPTTFFAALAVFYVLRWWKSASLRDAVFAGVLIGFATLVKQSALTWLPSGAIIPVLWLIATRHKRGRVAWPQALGALTAILLLPVLIAGVWYIRNVQIGTIRQIVPIAGEYHLLDKMTGWLGIAPSLAWSTDFAPWLAPIYALGWMIGLGFAAVQGINVLRGRAEGIPADLILAAFAVPYWLVWWRTFSFEARFLVLVLPMMAVWATRPVKWLAMWIEPRVSVDSRAVLRPLGILAMVALLLLGARDRLGAVYYSFTRPFASEEERVRHVKGDLYDLAVYIRTHLEPGEARIMAMDGRLPYYLMDYDLTVGYPLQMSDLEGYDYLVHSSSIYSVYNGRLGWNESQFYRYAFDTDYFEPVYEKGGVHIMRILRTDAPAAHRSEP